MDDQPLTPSERRRALEFIALHQKFQHIKHFQPYIKQRQFLDLGRRCRERLFCAGNRCGKALRNGTPVLTPTGWRAIESLKIGDEVIGGDGNPCQVIGVHPQGLKPLVELTFDDGASVVCSFDHLWKCKQGKSERFKKNFWNVRTTQEILDLGGIEGGHKRAEIPVCSSYLRRSETEIDPYIFGVMAGDGCYTSKSVQARLSSADEEIILIVGKHYKVSQSPSKSRQYDYAVTGMVTQLKNLGVWGTKAHEKTIPRDFLWTGKRERLELLRGLMDTDGFCSKDGYSTVFYSTSPGLVDAVVFIVRSLGGKAYVNNKQTYFYQNGVKVAGRPSWSVSIRISVCPFRLARKANRWKRSEFRGDERRLYRAIPIDSDLCTCIAVDSPDRTYVTKDFIVTHNTETGAYEAALHATGDYPSDWKGKRFDHHTIGWVCGQTSLAVRDICQAKLLGSPGVVSAQGTGMLPKDSIVDTSLARGVTDAIDTVQVRHISGGISIIRFKSYEQGRARFQGEGLDWIWFDEEPDLDIYSEGLTRIGERDGLAWMTFTPLLGKSSVVLRFMDEPSPDRDIVTMTIDDIPPNGHISPAAKRKIVEGYLPHEREARALGIPFLGSGRIFATPESAILEAPIEHIPAYWAKLWGIDIGIGHPFAAVLILWDKDNDVIHIHHTIRMSDTIPMIHAAAMKKIAAAVPVAYPKDAGDRDRGTGEPVSKLYKAQGLILLHEHATHPDGSVSTEAGLMEWDERERTGRLKVANHLSDWIEERRNYHRKDGQIVKIKDDLMSATRIALMMKRFARAVGLNETNSSRLAPKVAQNVDFDLFDGGAEDPFAA